MTAQIAEQIRIDGEDLAMCSEPLADYFHLAGRQVAFLKNCTALLRGYVGSWEILNDRLYLVGLSGYLADSSEANLATLFPGFPERVFAHWYSGTVRIPQGKLLKYVHGGYGSVYERDLFIRLERGVVVERAVQTHGVATNTDTPDGYRIHGMTVTPVARPSFKDEP